MFKGLRTKIENEQQGQAVRKGPQDIPVFKDNRNIKSNPESYGQFKDESRSDSTHDRVNSQHTTKLTSTEESATSGDPSNADSQSVTTRRLPDSLRDEITTLNDKLKTVIEERDECNDQNAQLYQLIEKMRKNLENEKEINSSLVTKLNEAESALKQRNNLFDSLRANSAKKNLSSKIIKDLTTNDNPQCLGELSAPEIIKILQAEILEVQSQVTKLNRQLKLKNQNVNDLKKSLQKELSEHEHTKEELHQLKAQLAQRSIENNQIEDQSYTSNGSPIGDIERNNFKQSNTNLNLIDKVEDSIPNDIDIAEDIGTNPSSVYNRQLDSISCISARSSASIDDYDTSDIQQGVASNREVNYEYLRNVLFRYMTSTDSETSQHLIKALTVLMNFSPEQSAAIKTAMSARSSWLRLK